MKGRKEVRSRWKEYLEDFINFKDGGKTELSSLGSGKLGSERMRVADRISEEERLMGIKKKVRMGKIQD